MGFLFQDKGAGGFDGGSVVLSGALNRTLVTDATGFFGAVDLPTGTYTLSVNEPGYRPLSRTIVVAGAAVAQTTLLPAVVPLEFTSVVRAFAPSRLTVTWYSVPGRTYRIEGTNDLLAWSPVASGVAAASASTTFSYTLPDAWNAQAFLRVT
ncbi:MAG: Xanthan lyase [Chthoniobacteraceae bacterium]|nr:Xanthan lyase [Chthoniobacteraceae bacterium]